MQPYARGGPIQLELPLGLPPAAPRMAGDPGFFARFKNIFGGGGAQGGPLAAGPAAKGAGAATAAKGLGAVGLGTLTAGAVPVGLEVLSQMSREDNPGDPRGNLARNAGGAAGAVTGGVAGGSLGLLGGPFAPITVPLGAWAGSSLLAPVGRATAGSIADIMGGTPEDRATQQAIRSNEAMARSQLGLAQEALPLETQRMEMARQFEQQHMNEMVMARARDTYQQALLGAASVPAGAYADPSFMQALAMAGRIG